MVTDLDCGSFMIFQENSSWRGFGYLKDDRGDDDNQGEQESTDEYKERK